MRAHNRLITSARLRLAGILALAALLLGGCTSLGYQQAFSACDDQVGACYRDCEADEGTQNSGSCQASCEQQATACFDRAYSRHTVSAGYGALSVTPWFGTYCAWYPDRGFVSSYGFYGHSHLGYSNSGFFPGRRYRPGNRYDPHYDDYSRHHPPARPPHRDRPGGDRPRRTNPDYVPPSRRDLRERPVQSRPGPVTPVERPPRVRPPGSAPRGNKPATRPPRARPPTSRRPPSPPARAKPPTSKPPASSKPVRPSRPSPPGRVKPPRLEPPGGDS